MRASKPSSSLSILPLGLLTVLAVLGGCSSSASKSNPANASGGTTAGPSGIGAPLAVSGSRLHVKSITGGGAREVVSFHDMQRNEDCTFQRAEGGRTRCLPATASAFQPGAFTDAACTVPAFVAQTATCADDVKYGVTFSPSNCGANQAAELRKLLAPATPLYQQTPTGCGPAPTRPVTPTNPATVPLGDAIPWTEFVEGTETIVPGPVVSEKIVVASDGARLHLGYRDDKLGSDCSFRLMSDGVTRCLPPAREGGVLFADASCTNPFAVNDYSGAGCDGSTSSDSVVSSLWLEPSPSACGGVKNVYRLGTYDGSKSGSTIYSLQLDYSGSGSQQPTQVTCSSNGELGSNISSFRTITANISASLPSLPRVSSGNGTDRLVPALVWPPASETLVSGWHDTMNDVDCTFALASDGKMRCLPTASSATILFTDDACKSPSQVAVLSDPSCIGLRRYARVVSSTCPPTAKIYALGSEAKNLTSASVLTSSGACGKVSQAMAAFDATEVDPSQFVEGVPAVE